MANWETLRRQIAIAGQVTDAATGKPIPGAQVQITQAPDSFLRKVNLRAKLHGNAWDNMTERVDRQETAADGAYFFLDLPDGDYTITAYDFHRLPSYDYEQNSGTVARDDQGTVQQIQLDVALSAFSGKTFAAPTFVPTDINDCQLWLQAEVLALADGTIVTSWPDNSGQNHQVEQAEVAKAPVYQSQGLNGRPTLSFDGANHYLTLNLANETTEHTFFAVYNHTPTEGSSNYLFEAQTGRLTLDIAQSSAPHNLRWNDGTWRTVDPALSGQQIVTWCFSDEMGELFRNGTAVGSATYSPQAIGGVVTLGANYQGRSSYFKGELAEFLYYNRALNNDERQTVETFLNGRYAIFP